MLACAAQREIEKVKKRREERALERVQQEEELSMIARERAVAEGVELEAKEEKVHIPLRYAVCGLLINRSILGCVAGVSTGPQKAMHGAQDCIITYQFLQA